MASLEEGDDSNFKNKTNGISVRRINTDNIIKGGGFGECRIIRILKTQVLECRPEKVNKFE